MGLKPVKPDIFFKHIYIQNPKEKKNVIFFQVFFIQNTKKKKVLFSSNVFKMSKINCCFLGNHCLKQATSQINHGL